MRSCRWKNFGVRQVVRKIGTLQEEWEEVWPYGPSSDSLKRTAYFQTSLDTQVSELGKKVSPRKFGWLTVSFLQHFVVREPLYYKQMVQNWKFMTPLNCMIVSEPDFRVHENGHTAIGKRPVSDLKMTMTDLYQVAANNSYSYTSCVFSRWTIHRYNKYYSTVLFWFNL